MNEYLWMLLGLFVPVLIWITKQWISNSIRESIRIDFEGRLEAIKSELRTSENRLQSELRAKESQIASLRDGVLEAKSRRQLLLDEKRLDSLESIWLKFHAADAFKISAQYFIHLNLEKLEEAASREQKVRTFVGTLNNNLNIEKFQDFKVSTEQLFIPDIVWAIFQAYTSILMTCFVHMKGIEAGVEKAGSLIKWDRVGDLTKAVLPHQSEFIDKCGATGLPMLLEEIEARMLTEVRKAISNTESDAEAVAQAAEIIKKVEAVMNPEIDVEGASAD